MDRPAASLSIMLSASAFVNLLLISISFMLAWPIPGSSQPSSDSRHFETVGYPPLPEAIAEVNAHNSENAAASAEDAAEVASKVAEHVEQIHAKTKEALGHASKALKNARVGTDHVHQGESQMYVRAAEEVTQPPSAELHGRMDNVKDSMDAHADHQQKLKHMEDDLGSLHDDLDRLKAGSSDKSLDDMEEELNALKKMLKDLEAEKGQNMDLDTIGAEIRNLRKAVRRYAAAHESKQAARTQNRGMRSLGDGTASSNSAGLSPAAQSGALDVDMDMPYGDLEPFGREDTAQELTEASIRESDRMVDQLERAEVAEEKRAVFRALTRLRGAAIASFDGVARAQTGNIDEYAKTHQWRERHPMKHLASEESDVSKWAFPDNADF